MKKWWMNLPKGTRNTLEAYVFLVLVAGVITLMAWAEASL